MTEEESDADNSVLITPADKSESVSLLEGLKSQSKSWVLALFKDVSKELRIIAKETIIFTAFIGSDMFIVWLLGLSLGDAYNWLYEGIRLISAITIALTYLGNCIIEINRSRRKVLAISQQTGTKEE